MSIAAIVRDSLPLTTRTTIPTYFFTILNISLMTYRDNDVDITMTGGYSLLKGYYSVTGFSVTPGQDPDSKIHLGLSVLFGNDGKMTFQVGRKGNSDVANWFNNQIPPQKNTFGHTAGDLNFAFLGTLSLTISGGSLGSNQSTYTFNDVALAQGKSGTSNNWWFGGKNCNNISNDQVTCPGTDEQGNTASFVFTRGTNILHGKIRVNEVQATMV